VFWLIPATALAGSTLVDILVFPQSSGGFWGGVTECGLGSTGPSRHAAPCCAQSRESGTRVGNDPVNAIAHGQSAQATAALDGPAADAVFVAAAAAPADAAANGAHGTGNGANGAANGADGAADAADPDAADLDDTTDAGTDAGTDADPVAAAATAPVSEDASANLDEASEPSDEVARPTEVTETLAASALVPDVRPAASAWDADRVVTEIYHGEYKSLVRLAVLLVHDVPTAEEVVQDAFEAMHTAWRRLREEEKALSYLRQAVVNRSRSVLRHRTVVDRNAPKPAPDEPSAEHGALALIERSAVIAALRTLPDRQREAVVLRYYADLSEADIAATMGISRGAVKSHTARAMAALKTILELETS
jgi:RNA polymerase sigma-70 factor (sigma-E family)